jgi:DNA-binding NtrC family response regulator
MPALLITGHLTENMRNRAAALEVSVLEKPFLGKRLIDLIRQALDGTRQQSS